MSGAGDRVLVPGAPGGAGVLRGPWPAFAALLALSAVVRAGVVLNATLDPDESQHLHAAWLVASGQVPFVDFWEHHMPVAYYLLAPLTRWFAESPAVYLAGRAAMTATAGVALILVYRLARRFDRTTAMAAVLLLAFLPRFVEHTTEVRPDPLALVAFLGALLALVRWGEQGSPRWLWVAGGALGLATSLTARTVFAAPGAIATIVIAPGQRRPALGRLLGSLTRLAAGTAGPLLLLLGGLWLDGGRPALGGFVDDALLGSLRFADFTKATPVPEESVGFLLLGLAGVLLTLRREGRRTLAHPVHRPLLLALASIGGVLALPTTPAVYRHAWLPVLPILAVYGAIALVTLADVAKTGVRPWARGLVVLACVGGLGVPAGRQTWTALHDANRTQLGLMERELRESCPGEPVLDGVALAVFRPGANRYAALVSGVRGWIARGVIPEERIVDDLSRTRPRLAHADWRVRGLIGPTADFLRRYYVATSDGLLRLGAAIPVTADSGVGRGTVELLATDFYRLSTPPGLTLTIDGTSARAGFVWLRSGRHAMAWAGPPGAITLTVATCPERRMLGRDAARPPAG